MEKERSERGHAQVSRAGEVHGSGSGADGEGNPNEEHGHDPMAGAGAEADEAPHDRPEGKSS